MPSSSTSFSDVRPVVVASHERSGTHLLIDLLRKQFAACATRKRWGEPMDRLYCSVDALSHGTLDAATAKDVLRRAPRPVIKTHGWPDFFVPGHDFLPDDWQAWLRDRADVLYMARDGRAVMCSYYLYMQYRPEARVPLSAFLRQQHSGMSRVKRWARHVQAWQAAPEAHVVTFERLLRHTSEALSDLEAHLGLEARRTQPLLPARLTSVWHSRFNRLFATQPESTAIVSGEDRLRWREAFSPADCAFFHEEAGDVLIDLGYESLYVKLS